MTLSGGDKKALSEIRFEKASEFLEDAQANLEESRFNTAINRSYYAALSAVRALPILEGVNPETHTGAVTMMSLRFVKSFKILLSRRADVDYGDFERITVSEAKDSLVKSEKILEQINAVRKKLIEEL